MILYRETNATSQLKKIGSKITPSLNKPALVVRAETTNTFMEVK